MCEGRVCVVTGAGRGIGREHALALGSRGAPVVVNDVGAGVDGLGGDSTPADEVVEAIIAGGGQAIANHDDISTWDGAESLIQSALETFGRLDVVVNNAGILRDRKIVSMTENDWDSVITVHLKGTFCVTRHAAAYWKGEFDEGRMNDARVINTTSSSGLFGNPGQANYGAAKAGIASFTVIAAMELARYGVTVNAISPGALTRMTDGLQLDDEMKRRWDPALVSPAVCWLASVGSSDVTGQVIESSGLALGVFEGWHRGPRGESVQTAEDVEAALRPLLAAARPPQSIR
jgi:NAD(P)-dependent dehydrogenase (short-subunit alcohol dehydrogenase family)